MVDFAVRCLWLVLVLSCLCPQTAQAQKKKKLKLNQYKRMHQDALAKIVKGDWQQAQDDLQAILQRLPEDAESHYMLAVALAKAGRIDDAVAAVKDALDAGLPKSRFLTGTKTGWNRYAVGLSFKNSSQTRKAS